MPSFLSPYLSEQSPKVEQFINQISSQRVIKNVLGQLDSLSNKVGMLKTEDWNSHFLTGLKFKRLLRPPILHKVAFGFELQNGHSC